MNIAEHHIQPIEDHINYALSGMLFIITRLQFIKTKNVNCIEMYWQMEIISGSVELSENRNSEEGAENAKSPFYQTTTKYEFRADLLFL